MRDNKNILKVDSAESIVNFVKSVESENSDKVSEMVRNDVDMFYDIDVILRKIRTLSDEGKFVEDVDVVRSLVLELHHKLLLMDHLNHQHLNLMKELFDNTKLVYHVLKQNKELIL
jgi:hypothetical protein